MYKMSMGTFTSADVYCDMTTDGGGWIVIQRNRKNSQLSFNKNWREYEDGFGDVNDDFWVGLKLMNTLTQYGQWEMRVDFQKNDKSWSYLHYNQFSVGSVSDKYRLKVAGYTGGVEIILQQVMNLQIMLNSPLMIMIMMLPVVTVQLVSTLDSGTTAVMTFIQTVNHLIMIIQILHCI